MVAEGRFAPLPSLVLFWRSLDREVPVDSILNINNMASGLHIFHLGFFLIPLIFPILYAGVVELADTRDLKSLAVWHTGSIPVSSTISGCTPVGRRRDLGSRGRGFESHHSDQ